MKKFCSNCGADLRETNGVCKKCENSSNFINNGKVDRKALKEAAKEKLNNNLGNIWKPIIIIYLISFAFGLVAGIFFDPESDTYAFVSLLAEVLLLPTSAGLTLYMLNLIRGKEYNLSDLFSFYDNRFWQIIVISFLIGLFTILWSCLFIIPGIIAALSYSMALYIYADGTKTNPLEVIKESKRLMHGHKLDYFVFGLSFFGWIILGVFTLGLAYIYVIPYMTLAQTMYYEELKKIAQ